MDFGLARRTFLQTEGGAGGAEVSSTAGLPVGTLRYMSPEQCRGESATPASDVFGAGLVLYEILTGSHPFHADSPLDTAHRIASLKARSLRQVNPEIPDDINGLVARMLTKDAGVRPTSQSVAEGLTRAMLLPRQRAIKRRPVYRVGAALAIIVFVVLGALWWTTVFRKVKPADACNPDLKITLLTGLRGLEQKPTFSPDGTRVAFEFSNKDSAVGNIYVKDIAAGTLTRLTNDKLPDFQPVFSPDGTKLAFLRRGLNGKLRLMIMPSTGGMQWQVGEIAGDIQLLFRVLTWDARERT